MEPDAKPSRIPKIAGLRAEYSYDDVFMITFDMGICYQFSNSGFKRRPPGRAIRSGWTVCS
jgi:hypothetical protein